MNQHDKGLVDRLLPEPPDGTRLVVDSGGNDFRVIWRDDAAAKDWFEGFGDTEGWRWFDVDHGDPMSLYELVRFADAVYPLGSKPVARFRTSDAIAGAAHVEP